MNKQNKLTVKEREKIAKLISGQVKPDSTDTQRILNRPHVAITFEAILNKAGLTEDKLAKKLKDIIGRKAIEKIDKEGRVISTTQQAVDANTTNVVRMIWQAQGKFVQKVEVEDKTGLKEAPDEYLDSIIEGGTELLKSGEKQKEDESSGNGKRPKAIPK